MKENNKKIGKKVINKKLKKGREENKKIKKKKHPLTCSLLCGINKLSLYFLVFTHSEIRDPGSNSRYWSPLFGFEEEEPWIWILILFVLMFYYTIFFCLCFCFNFTVITIMVFYYDCARYNYTISLFYFHPLSIIFFFFNLKGQRQAVYKCELEIQRGQILSLLFTLLKSMKKFVASQNRSGPRPSNFLCSWGWEMWGVV